MTRKIILDTNIVYSLFKSDDANHSKAVKEIRELADTDSIFYISNLVVAELLCALEGKEVVKMCEALTEEIIYSNEEDLAEMQRIPMAVRRKLKSNDCLIWAMSKRLNAELITFDKAFKKLA